MSHSTTPPGAANPSRGERGERWVQIWAKAAACRHHPIAAGPETHLHAACSLAAASERPRRRHTSASVGECPSDGPVHPYRGLRVNTTGARPAAAVLLAAGRRPGGPFPAASRQSGHWH